jgi:hypothetical protein
MDEWNTNQYQVIMVWDATNKSEQFPVCVLQRKLKVNEDGRVPATVAAV